MNFHKGDKVRFLNEKGEGTVTRILGSSQVMVEVEDGFEFPFPVSQLVPAQPIEGSPRLPKPEAAKPAATIQKEKPRNLNPRQPDGVYLLLVPQNQHIPSAGMLDLLLINHSDYEVYYTLSLKENSTYTCVQAGHLGVREQAEVEALTPQEVDNWATLKCDLLFFSEETYEHKAPVSETVRFRGVKLFKDSTYTDHLLIGRKACVFEIAPLEAVSVAAGTVLTNDDLQRMLREKERNTTNQNISKPHHKNLVLEKEVDLHIEELLDNWNGMSNAQLLDVQLRRMQQELDEAIAAHLHKIIFIHGVGNGRLKQEVVRVLKTYRGIRFHDASYSKYGAGATEVVIL